MPGKLDMRPVRRTGRTSGVGTTSKSSVPSKAGPTDSVSFSPQAVELQGIVADALEQPEVRMELVQQARAELEKGLPGFDPDMLAAALLQDIFDIPMEDL